MNKYYRKISKKLERIFYKTRFHLTGKYIVLNRNSFEAFEDAIILNHLSRNPEDDHYAGNYMYMQTINGIDRFKHKVTRNYLDNY